MGEAATLCGQATLLPQETTPLNHSLSRPMATSRGGLRADLADAHFAVLVAQWLCRIASRYTDDRKQPHSAHG